MTADHRALIEQARALHDKVLPPDGGTHPEPTEPDVRFIYWRNIFLHSLDPGPQLLERLEGVALFSTYKALAEMVARLAEALEQQEAALSTEVTEHCNYVSDTTNAALRLVTEKEALRLRALAAERRVAELEQEYTEYQEHTAVSHQYMVDESANLARELKAAKTIVKAARHLVYCFLPGPGRCPMCGGGNGKGDGNGHCSTCALGALAAALAAGEGEG